MRPLAGLFGATACLLVLGCSGSAQSRSERDDDFAKYSATDVQKRFKEVTGATLRGSGGSAIYQSLRVDPGSRPSRGAYERYGGVSIIVTGNKPTLKSITKRSGLEQRKVIGNVVIEDSGSSFGDGRGFERVVAVLSSLGKPASAAKLAPGDTPCDRLGIDLDDGSGKEGVCTSHDQKTVEVVNSTSRLELQGKTLSGVRVTSGRTLVARRYGTTRRYRARGAYVLVSFKIANTGNAPLRSPGADLIVDGKRFSQDEGRSFDVQSADVFPLQPGESQRTAALFDMPVPAARAAVADGSLELSADTELSSPEVAARVGRIRLGRAPDAGRKLVR